MTRGRHEALISHIAEGDIITAGRALSRELSALGLADADAQRFGELIEGVWWSQLADAEKMRRTVTLVVRVTGLARQHGLLPAVLGFIRIVCEEAWELSWDHRPILEVIGCTGDGWEPDTAPDGSAEEHAALGALWLLPHELRTESAVSVGSPARLAEAAEHGRRHAARLLEVSLTLSPGPLRTWLVDLAEETGNRLAASAVAARTALTALTHGCGAECRDGTAGPTDTGRHAGPGLAEAIRTLEEVEADGRIAAESASEIRSHRAALRGIQAAAGRDWLRVDEGTVTHVFPFGLRTHSHTELIEAVKAHGAGWSLAGRPLGNVPSSLLLIDDIWRGEDALNQRYEGTQLDLPPVQVRICEREFTLQPSIVLSQIGNHHLRFTLGFGEDQGIGQGTTEHPGLLPHEMAAACLLPTPEYGDLRELGQPLDFVPQAVPDLPQEGDPAAGRAGWSRLGDLAAECLRDLRDHLAAVGVESTLSYRAGMFHVITQIRRASALPGGDPRRARTLTEYTELPGLFGSGVVLGPLPSGVGSIADWAIGTPRQGTTVPTAIATDTLLSVNINHTLIASLTAPSFMMASVLEVVEFSVSLEGMFAAWQDELTGFQQGIHQHRERYPGVASMEEASHHEVDAVISRLEQDHTGLRRFVSTARTSLLFIDSPALVASPVIRQTLNDLLALNQVWVRRAEYTDAAGDSLSQRYEEVIGAWVQRREARKEARNRVMVETLLAVVAGIGISGIASLMQEGFGMTGWWDTLWLILAVVVLAALIGVLAYRWTRHTPRRPRRPRRRPAPEETAREHP